jgi:uncharacterized protein YndB with AHSA1/START domain
VWQIVERAEIAAPPRLVWTIVSDVDRHAEIAGSGEARAIRIDVNDEPTEFAWTSYLPLDDGETGERQVEVQWWFRLAPSWTGTALEHGVRVPRPGAGADELAEFLERSDRVATVRRGMVTTLTNVKRRAEVSAR